MRGPVVELGSIGKDKIKFLFSSLSCVKCIVFLSKRRYAYVTNKGIKC